jgi:ech hydrogenase subunit D
MSKPQFVETPAAELLARCAEFKEKGWRFSQCCAVRTGVEGVFEVLYTFCDDATNEVANLRVRTGAVDELPSVSGLFPCAFMFENEMHDLFGLRIEGINIDYSGGFYHLHIPTPMAIAAERAAKKAPKAAE